MSFILDASAVLALLNGEPGAERVEACLSEGAISAVNAAEVATRLVDAGMPADEAFEALRLLALPILVFDADAALDASRLRTHTRQRGLSLGDRACLATAASRNAIAVTADRAWQGIEAGCAIEVIR